MRKVFPERKGARGGAGSGRGSRSAASEGASVRGSPCGQPARLRTGVQGSIPSDPGIRGPLHPLRLRCPPSPYRSGYASVGRLAGRGASTLSVHGLFRNGPLDAGGLRYQTFATSARPPPRGGKSGCPCGPRRCLSCVRPPSACRPSSPFLCPPDRPTRRCHRTSPRCNLRTGTFLRTLPPPRRAQVASVAERKPPASTWHREGERFRASAP